MREVAEETGLTCRIVGFLDTLVVEADDGVHRFHIFDMERVDGAFVPNRETDRAEWFRVADAIVRATYPNVRDLLASFSRR